MKKVFLPILLLHLTMMVNAATYYFSSSSGNDSRSAAQAQNSSTPWKSISKLNSIMSTLQPGDQVLFKSGDTFYGGYSSINITVSGNSGNPITFGSYGSGNKPVINGFSYAMNWKQVRSNVWEAPFWQPHGKEAMVIKNNQQQGIGRYPNISDGKGGYLNIDANNGSSQITSNSLPSSPNWTGADIVVRKNHWTLDRTAISSQSGNTLNFAPVDGNPIFSNNFGFFIVNNTNTLDQDGEWYYDRSRSRLQMYFSNNNPNSYLVLASTVDTLVNISFEKYITFSNLSFVGANAYCFNLTNSDNITISNCNINFTGIEAVRALSSQYFTLQNSRISNTNNNGVNLYWYCNNALIQNDTITNTALIAGMNQNAWNGFQGISIVGDNNMIQYCEVDSSGANGIHFDGNYSTIQNCYVNAFGLTVDDCAGIYTGQGLGDTAVYLGKSVLNNIVVNGVGANAGTPDPTYIPVNGIYFDDNSNHVTAIGNTTANCPNAGFFAHHNNNVTIQNNTFYNNGAEQFLGMATFRNLASNVTFQNNICFSKTASQLACYLESDNGVNDLPNIGNLNNNYYCRPIDDNYMFYSMYEIGNTGQYNTYNQNLSTWQSFLGMDAGSKTSPATIPASTISNVSGINLFSNGSFASNANGVAKWSPKGDANVSWVSNKLDGGTLQLSANNYSSNSFYVTLPTDVAITAGTSCLLSFTMQGAVVGSSMTVYLKQQDPPNNPTTQKVIIPIPANRQDFQFGFIPTITGRVSIELDIAQPTGVVWLDNVMLQQATIKPTNPDDYIVFQYNPGKTVKTFTLNDTYMDAKGATYSGTVTLQPYTSLVLFKQPAQGLAQTAKASQAISLQGNLVSASSASIASSATTKLNWKVENQSSTASYYEVQRSSDAQNFTAVGKATVKTEGASVVYQYNDASPLAGKNYYRITQHNQNGNVVLSPTVVVTNISFKVNPNPAKDVIHVSFDKAITASDNLDKEVQIHNAAGVLVQTVRLSSTDNLSRTDINVASLQKGVYMLSVTSEGQTFSKTFLKQ